MHLIFILLHLICFFVFLPGLVVTIPLHMIFLKVGG